MKFRFCFLALLAFLSGCKTEVVSVKQDQPVQLGEQVGYLLLGLETNTKFKSIKITGPQNLLLTAKDLKIGTNYILFPLKSGKYNLKDVSFGYEGYRLTGGVWSFEIDAQKISYVGHFELKRLFYGGLSVELVNRASEALEFMENQYPNILKSKTVTYRGPGEDGFLDFATKMGEGI